MVTQSMLANSARGYIKSKMEQHVLQQMSWPAQSADLNPIEQVWDEIYRKVRAKWPTSGAHLRQLWEELFSVFLQCLVEKIPRICEAVIAAKGGHFDESNV